MLVMSVYRFIGVERGLGGDEPAHLAGEEPGAVRGKLRVIESRTDEEKGDAVVLGGGDRPARETGVGDQDSFVSGQFVAYLLQAQHGGQAGRGGCPPERVRDMDIAGDGVLTNPMKIDAVTVTRLAAAERIGGFERLNNAQVDGETLGHKEPAELAILRSRHNQLLDGRWNKNESLYYTRY
jgi:hypothetical protein